MLEARKHIQIIQKKYDPENDTIPGAPAVTWTDMQLSYIADRMRREIGLLQTRVEQLERELGRERRERLDLERRVL